MTTLKRLLIGFLVILGLYLFGRAIVELFIIHYGDPSSYRNDWGGPSLAGVLAVHCGFGLISAVLIARWIRRKFISDRRNARV